MLKGEARKQFGYLLFLCFFGTVFTGAPLPRHDTPKCETLSLDNCLKKLQVFLRITSLPFAHDSKDLDKLCEMAVSGYNCSQVLLQNPDCLTLQNKETLPVFISMAEYTYSMFCNKDGKEGYLSKDLLEHSECLIRHKGEIDCCSEETHVPDLPVLRILEESSILHEKINATCCPISSYIQCVSIVAMHCSESAANFTVEYIRRATGEKTETLCEKLQDYPYTDEETCTKPVPVCSSSIMIHLDKHAIIMCFSLLSWFQYQKISFFIG